jgi:hypothetical protein
MSSGCAASFSFTAVMRPDTGEYRSLAALTDSTTPKLSPAASLRPGAGRSRKTTSPSCDWAKSVMPTVTVLPSAVSHS